MRDGSPLPARRRGYLLRGVIALLVVIDLLAGGGALFLRSQDRAAPVSVEQAVARFRAETPGGAAVPAPSSTAATVGLTSAPASVPSASTTSVPPTAPGPRAADPAAGAARAPVASPAPQPGVYLYDTTGFEETDALGGARHDYPERTTITVRSAGCGQTFRWDVLEQRSDTIELCPAPGGGAHIAAWESRHEFFGRRDERRLSCQPGSIYLPGPGATAGTVWRYRCSSETTERVTSVTVLGRETVRVGAVDVTALHLREDSTGEGDSTGTAVRELWLREHDGLLVRERTDIDMTTQAGAIRARYRERYELRLVDLRPEH